MIPAAKLRRKKEILYRTTSTICGTLRETALTPILQSIYFALLYTLTGLFISRRRQLSRTLQILFAYLAIYTLFNSTAWLMQQLKTKNNLFLSHFLTPIEYSFLAVIYYRSLESPLVKRIILVSIPLFVTGCLLLTLYVEKLKENDSYARIVEALLITFWVLDYLKEVFGTHKLLNIHRDPVFWISTGFLTYFIGVLFIQGLLNELIKHDLAMASTLYRSQYLFEYNLFIQIGIALFCHQIFKEKAVP